MFLISTCRLANMVELRSTPIASVSVIVVDLSDNTYRNLCHLALGRTGRIGNLGVATSFYNERDADLAEELTKTLMETNQEIPDFLEQFKPDLGEGAELRFEADSGDEEEGTGGDGDGGWGAATVDTAAAPAMAESATADVVVGWGATDEAELRAPVAPVAAPAAAPVEVLVKMSWGVEVDPAIVQKAAGWNTLADDRAAFATGWTEHVQASPAKVAAAAPVPKLAAVAEAPAPAAPSANWDTAW
jgi:ATP-dependent RNA helicase DDX3X